VIIGADDHGVHTFDLNFDLWKMVRLGMFDIELGDTEHDISAERAQITVAILQHE
jgi:hypothetical protein